MAERRLGVTVSGEKLIVVHAEVPATGAAAVRELLRRGLAAEGFLSADGGMKSGDYGVVEDTKESGSGTNGAG